MRVWCGYGRISDPTIEYVDPTHSTLLKRIDDDIEFAEIEEFLRQAGILKVDLTKEFKIADKKH